MTSNLLYVDDESQRNGSFAVRNDNMKLINHRGKYLYNLETDPDERNDLSHDLPNVVDELYNSCSKSALLGDTVVLDEEAKQALRALGYVAE